MGEGKRKKSIETSESSVTFVLIEHGEGRRRGVGVPQPHRPVGGAGQQPLVGAAVHQAPHRVRVSAQRPPQHRRVCESQSSGSERVSDL